VLKNDFFIVATNDLWKADEVKMEAAADPSQLLETLVIEVSRLKLIPGDTVALKIYVRTQSEAEQKWVVMYQLY
jgi:hypothetical protein